MNLESSKVTPEEKVELCKKYFYLGWLALPFVWGINAVWFYKEAFIKPEFPGQVKNLRTFFQPKYFVLLRFYSFSKRLNSIKLTVNLANYRRQSRSW